MTGRDSGLAVRHPGAELRPDPARVIAQLFLAGEELPGGHSRTANVVARVLALPEDEVELLAAQLLDEFSSRHRNYRQMLDEHVQRVGSQLRQPLSMSPSRRVVLGASFTAEYAVEGAALCNPSAVLHPDQGGLGPGQARAAVSLRGIGEGHLSGIEFATAVIGPGPAWEFEQRAVPVVAGVSSASQWRREHLRAVLADQGALDGLAHSVLAGLPEAFSHTELQQALADAHPDLLYRSRGTATADLLRGLVASAYQVDFPADVALSQRVLLPSTDEESKGMEDARFVRFLSGDGTVEYCATYTAYDGRQIAPHLLTSPDLRVFRAHRLAGPAARDKGMALFPRLVGGRHVALCRSDGENTSVASSVNGLVWDNPQRIREPPVSWKVLQVGNCGSPIETDRGWLVLTHGVGPMRVYSIGAMLLDLDDPTTVLARLEQPLLQADSSEQDGYVPNVVYSCGGIVHEGRLWLPYGIGDARIGVAWTTVDELIAAMTPVAAGQ